MDDIASLFREYGLLVARRRSSSLTGSEAGRLAQLEEILDGVAERRQVEESLNRAQKLEAIGQLSTGIAHDFNNLLTAMNFYVDLQLRQLSSGTSAHDAAQQLRVGLDRASMLAEQLLNFGRRRLGDPQPVDLNDVVRGMIELLERPLGEHITVRVDLNDEPARIHADRGQLEQVVMNLALNGRDAMPGGGTLRISTRLASAAEARAAGAGQDPRRYVRLTVSDVGVGMDESTRARAFEPFFTTKASGEGTGLGLVTVGAIVTEYGGVIRVDSQRGAGTRLDVYLPEAEASSRA